MFKTLIAIVSLSPLIALADGEFETQISCTTDDSKFSISHVRDTTDTVGEYELEQRPYGSEITLSSRLQSTDYFRMMDAFWQKGTLQFESSDSPVSFQLDGSVFAKRDGVLTIGNVKKNAKCRLLTKLPLVTCETSRNAAGEFKAFHFRHGTDLGTTTGYYITRQFDVASAAGNDFSTAIVGSFSVNRRLVDQFFHEGKDVEFKTSTGDIIALNDWKSSAKFSGKAQISGEIYPIDCAFLSETPDRFSVNVEIDTKSFKKKLSN